jgi:predicted alpha/beta hydrolase family esterase
VKKRFIIVHKWDGHPEDDWYPWLKNELKKKGFEVSVPQLPDTSHPRIEKWVPALAATVGVPNENTFLIGHSMGGETIGRYLESLSGDLKIGGAVFVAGFFKRLTGLEDSPDVKATVDHWLLAPIDLKKVATRLGKSVALFSDNDEYVPLDNQDDFRDMLGSEIVIEHAKGHFTSRNGVSELPAALSAALKIAG